MQNMQCQVSFFSFVILTCAIMRYNIFISVYKIISTIGCVCVEIESYRNLSNAH